MAHGPVKVDRVGLAAWRRRVPFGKVCGGLDLYSSIHLHIFMAPTIKAMKNPAILLTASIMFMLLAASCGKEMTSDGIPNGTVYAVPKSNTGENWKYKENNNGEHKCPSRGEDCSARPPHKFSPAGALAFEGLYEKISTGDLSQIKAAFQDRYVDLSEIFSAEHMDGVIDGTLFATCKTNELDGNRFVLFRDSHATLKMAYMIGDQVQ